jgi:O-antigen/teichoic acid export membrane protein
MLDNINITHPENHRVSDKVIKNTAYNFGGKIWFLVMGIFLTPYIISRIGGERFAVWALVGVVTNYFGLLDFGVGSSFVRNISEFYTRKDYSSINKLVNTGFSFYILFALVILAITIFLLGPLMVLLKIPAAVYLEARFVFLLGIAVFCVNNAMGPFIAIQMGLQRMDIANKIAIFVSLVSVAGTIFFLEKGYGLRGLMVNNALAFTLTSLIYIFCDYRILPQLKFRPFRWDKSMFKRIFSFGFKVQVSHISGTITNQTDKLLITYFLSIGLVTYYQLGSSIILSAMALPALLVSALVPAFSEIAARGDRRKLIESYLRSTKYLTFFTAPLFVFVAALAGRIMFIWVGTGYEQSVGIIQILAAAFLVNMFARVSAALCLAIEKPEHLMNASLIMIFANIILSVVFIKLFGFPGVAWGTLVAVNAGTVYFLGKLHQNLSIPTGIYLKATWPFCRASLFAGAFIFAIDFSLRGLFPPATRVVELAILFATGIIFSLVYLLALYSAKLFDADDSDFLRDKFPFLHRILRKFLVEHGQ